MTDLEKFTKLFDELGVLYNIEHCGVREFFGKKYPGATTLSMEGDNDAIVHFYFDLPEDGGKIRSNRPTTF
jgi:hypothetical protein